MRYAAVQMVRTTTVGEREPKLYVATKYPEFHSWKKSKAITAAKQQEFPSTQVKDGKHTQDVWFYNLSEKNYNELCGN